MSQLDFGKQRKTPLSESEILEEHKRALEEALAGFYEKRNHLDFHDEDEYKSRLIEMIKSSFEEMNDINKSKNKVALQAAIRAYEDYMASAWESNKVCIHPDDLDEEHSEGERRALTAFRPNKISSEKVFDTTDDDEGLLAKILSERFTEIERNNNSANETAVQAAANVYSKGMYYNCGFSGWWLLFGIAWAVNKSRRIYYHKKCKDNALDEFYRNRHGTSRKEGDRFFDELESKIADESKKY